MSSDITTPQPITNAASSDFTQEAEAPQMSLMAEFLDFLVNNKAWWLTPIILVLLAVGVLIALSSTAAAPFIYTLF